MSSTDASPENSRDRGPIRILAKPHRAAGSIANLSHDYYYVREDENVLDFADALQKNPEVDAVCVVDTGMKIRGIITRSEFFHIMGRPYGRDLHKNKRVSSVMSEVRDFAASSSVLAVAEQLKNELRINENKYYALHDDAGGFAGIFTSKSVLVHLSDMTQRDLELAEKLQQRIVSEEFHACLPELEIVSYSKMAKGVGGDFYTFRNCGEGQFVVALCDVSGKGMSASLVASLLGGFFSVYDFANGLSPFIAVLNRYIAGTFKLEKFITAAICGYDAVSRTLTVFDMGHSFIFVLRGDSVLAPGNAGNIPIGVDPDWALVSTEMRIEKNDLLFIYSDGVIEQSDETGVQYGAERLETLAKSVGGLDPVEIKSRIVDDLALFKKQQDQQDDITFTILRFH